MKEISWKTALVTFIAVAVCLAIIFRVSAIRDLVIPSAPAASGS